MRKKKSKSILLIIVGLLLQFNLLAQGTSMTLHVGTAGTLPSLIGENRKCEITDLTLSGNLNGTDIQFIREMAGRGRSWGTVTGNLSMLDISMANIVSGGGYYEALGVDRTLPTSDNKISDYMFQQCKLKNITLPINVTSIGVWAFMGCDSLTNVVIPNSVTSIGRAAFGHCVRLTNIIIPNSVISIGDSAFENCYGLTSVTIPNSVISIGNSTFCWCIGLTNVIISNSVTSIGENAFSYCGELTSVTIPNGVTSIGRAAFWGCTALTSIIIPNNVTSIGESAFALCYGLTDIIFLSNKITSIANETFYRCIGLINVTIPNGVTSIGDDVFFDCNELTSITIPRSVTSIGRCVLYDCESLIAIHSNNPDPPLLTDFINNTNGGCFYYDGEGRGIGGAGKKCKLYVPKSSYSRYKSAPGWRDFTTIEEDGTAINAISKDIIKVQSISNGIVIEMNKIIPVSIFNISGQKVYESVINGIVEISLNKGVYIVRINNESQKVIVH